MQTQDSQGCWALISDIIRVLRDSDDTVAKEVGGVWQKVFTFLEDHPEHFNELQDSHPQNRQKIIEKFFHLTEARYQNRAVSDDTLIEAVAERSQPLDRYSISKEIADALGAFGMFLVHAGQHFIDVPSRLPYTVALFGIGKKLLQDLLKAHDLSLYQRDIILRIAEIVPKHRFRHRYFSTIAAGANIERLLGFSVRLLSQRDVYVKGPEFYRLASILQRENTLTFANTSGLWNPLERLGSSEFQRRYRVRPRRTVELKDGYRAKNFSLGVLNNDYACTRLYFYNPVETWVSFRKARQAAQNLKRFDSDSRIFVAEVANFISQGKLHLVSLQNFSSLGFPQYVTRISPEVVMFSNRKSDRANISHGLWCALSGRETRSHFVHEIIDIARERCRVIPGLSLLLSSVFKKIESVPGEAMRYILLHESEPCAVTDIFRKSFGFDCRRSGLKGEELREQLEEQIKMAQQTDPGDKQ